MTASLFALLTRLRLSRQPMDLTAAAKQQHLFPLIGLSVGLLAAALAIVLDWLLGGRNDAAITIVVLASLYYITGILHTEGLADFADGLIASGPKERKKEAMKDVHTGVGGVFAVSFFLVAFFLLALEICRDPTAGTELFPLPWKVYAVMGFVMAEVAGKLSMNTAMYLGPSAHPGMGSLFVDEAGVNKLVISMGMASLIGVLVAGYMFPIVFVGVVAGAAVTVLARKHFGGVSGDAFGAANELGRICTLLVWVVVI